MDGLGVFSEEFEGWKVPVPGHKATLHKSNHGNALERLIIEVPEIPLSRLLMVLLHALIYHPFQCRWIDVIGSRGGCKYHGPGELASAYLVLHQSIAISMLIPLSELVCRKGNDGSHLF